MTDLSAVERAQQWRRAQPYYASEQFMEDGESWVRADTVEVWLAAYAAAESQRADQCDASLVESRAREVALKECLKQLVEKLDVVLPRIDGMIGLQFARTGRQYDGPNLVEEMKRARLLLKPELGTPDR